MIFVRGREERARNGGGSSVLGRTLDESDLRLNTQPPLV
jgi:hypothetical protein